MVVASGELNHLQLYDLRAAYHYYYDWGFRVVGLDALNKLFGEGGGKMVIAAKEKFVYMHKLLL